jgi:hypothetical protein
MNAIEQLQSAKNTVNSVTQILNSGFEFEAWERKEYEAVLAEAKNEVANLTSIINENFDVFGVTV